MTAEDLKHPYWKFFLRYVEATFAEGDLTPLWQAFKAGFELPRALDAPGGDFVATDPDLIAAAAARQKEAEGKQAAERLHPPPHNPSETYRDRILVWLRTALITPEARKWYEERLGRTKAEVKKPQSSGPASGCCERFFDMSGCDCMVLAK